MLGDVGGLNDLLKSFAAFFISILQYQIFDNYLVSQLYKEQKNIDRRQLSLLSNDVKRDLTHIPSDQIKLEGKIAVLTL